MEFPVAQHTSFRAPRFVRFARFGLGAVVALNLGIVLVVPAGCGTPVDVDGNPAALRFVDLPAAFVAPDDDSEPDVAGFQAAVSVGIDNLESLSGSLSIQVQGPEGTSTVNVDESDVIVVPVTLEGSPSPGRESTISATLLVDGTPSTDVDAISQVVTLVTEDAPPKEIVLPDCELRIDADGDVRVLCSGGDPDSINAQNIIHGGLVAVRFEPEGEPARGLTRLKNLNAGSAIFGFPFDEVGTYAITMTLSGSTDVFGELVQIQETRTVTP